jgi:hypothetical protein
VAWDRREPAPGYPVGSENFSHQVVDVNEAIVAVRTSRDGTPQYSEFGVEFFDRQGKPIFQIEGKGFIGSGGGARFVGGTLKGSCVPRLPEVARFRWRKVVASDAPPAVFGDAEVIVKTSFEGIESTVKVTRPMSDRPAVGLVPFYDYTKGDNRGALSMKFAPGQTTQTAKLRGDWDAALSASKDYIQEDLMVHDESNGVPMFEELSVACIPPED